jgi:hypothetical protein
MFAANQQFFRFSRPTILAGIVAALGLGTLSAQSTSPANDGATDRKEEIITLSPFVINTERDVGFVAASSLAGGRLGGDLKDTPVAYSVLTRDFIDALDLTDFQDMAQWMPNTVETPNQGDTDWASPSYSGVTSRGVGTNEPQRDFFPYGINFDSYNIGRLDYGRGPNSILFGNSGYGSTPNVVSKRARPDKQFSEVRLSFGSWSNFRETLDHNQPLSDTLALRFNALYLDRDGWRDNDFEQKKAVTLAGTWQPTQRTEVRFEAERGEMEKASMGTNFYDYLSGWDGIHTYSAPAAANTAYGVYRIPSNYAMFTPAGGDTLLNFGTWATTDAGNRTAAIPLGGQLVAGVAGINTNSSIINQLNLPENRFDIAEANSHFRVPSREFSIVADGLQYDQKYYNYTLAVTQQVGENFYAEAAVNLAGVEYTGDKGLSSGQGGQTRIDLNTKLPNGADNPNFLQPYNFMRPFPQVTDSEMYNARLAMAYVLDNTRFGSFRFSVNGGMSRQDDTKEAWTYMRKIATDHRLWASQDRVYFLYHWNETARPYDLSDRTWMYQASTTAAPVPVEAGLVRDLGTAGANSLTSTDKDYFQINGDAKFFKKRLNVLAGLRRDFYNTRQQVSRHQYDYPTDWNGKGAFYKPDAPDDYYALTYQPLTAGGVPAGPVEAAETRPRIGNERDPLYANARFQDDFSPPVSKGALTTYSMGAVYHLTDHISLMTNYAESYVPALASFDFSGNLIAPRSAEGRDYGVRFTLLKGQVVANVIRYEGLDANSVVAVSGPRSNIDTIARTSPLDAASDELNARNFPRPSNGASDTTRKEISGWELDVTANLTQNWRLTLNGAISKAYQVSAYPLLKAFLADNKDTMKQIIQDAGGVFNGDVATMNPAIDLSRTPEGPGAVAAWNSLMATVASFTDEKQTPLRLMSGSGNVYTDYSFKEGRLKGLRVGIGANYRGKQVIGYRGADTIRVPNSATATMDDPSVGPLDSVYQPAYTTATAVINYTWRISRKLRCDLTLRASNLFDYAKPIYINTEMRPPNGDLTNPSRVTTPENYIWITPRNVTLTASFRF